MLKKLTFIAVLFAAFNLTWAQSDLELSSPVGAQVKLNRQTVTTGLFQDFETIRGMGTSFIYEDWAIDNGPGTRNDGTTHGFNSTFALGNAENNVVFTLPIYFFDSEGFGGFQEDPSYAAGLDVRFTHSVNDNLRIGAHVNTILNMSDDAFIDDDQLTYTAGVFIGYTIEICEDAKLNTALILDYNAAEHDEQGGTKDGFTTGYGVNLDVKLTEMLSLSPYVIYWHDHRNRDVNGFAYDGQFYDTGIDFIFNMGDTWTFTAGISQVQDHKTVNVLAYNIGAKWTF